VTIVQGPDGDELSINGQKGITNNVSVDGADFNNPFFGEQRGGQRPAFTFNLDAVKEMVVIADGANAEFGRSTSGFVNVITKSGTNDMNGTAHFVLKNDALSSNPKNPNGTTAPKFKQHQYQTGFTLGGPIMRDQLFYFAAADFQVANGTKQTDPARIEQRVVDAFAGLGSPGENLPIERTNDARVFLAKTDWNLSAGNVATLRYNYTWSEQKNGTFDVDSWGRSANAIEKDSSNALTGALVTAFSGNLLNEFRFQTAKENRPRPYNGPNITGQSRPLPDTAFDFGRSYRFGEPFFIPVTYYDTRIQFNERWEAQIEPDPITPASQVFYAGFYGKTVNGQAFPSNGKIPSDKKMFQPRLGMSWNPNGDGRSVLRANAGIFYGRVPGLTLASSRSTNGSRGQSIFRSSAAAPFLGSVPTYPNLIPQSQIGNPDHPDVTVFDKNFKNPRTTSASVSWEQEVVPNYSMLVKYNYAKGDHITRFVNRNDPLLGSPWSSGLGADGKNGIGALTVVESTAKSKYDGVTLGITKRPTHNVQFQVYYTYSKDKSDDDNERDPFTFRYAKVTDLAAEYGYSDRDQRHRLNGWLLWNAPMGLDLNARYSYRSAQPQSLTATGAVANTPQDRINADGSVTQRNLGRKDNQYSSLDFRLSKDFKFSSYTVQPALDAFNVFNSKNLHRPEVTSLIFNFDGTVQSGVGEPRQMQVGVRIIY
jgi:hypothetical protein